MNHPARAFETQNNLVLRSGHGKHGGHFFTQGRHFVRIHAAFKIEHIDPRFGDLFTLPLFGFQLRGFRLELVLFLLRFVPQFLLMTVEQRHRHFFLHLCVLLA
ncbi:hypothetical protein D3C75_965440 [compost metagenome]